MTDRDLTIADSRTTSATTRAEPILVREFLAARRGTTGTRSDLRERPQRRFRADALRRRMLAVADLIAGGVCTAAVLGGEIGWLWALAPAPLWILVAKLLGLYDRDHRVIRHLTVDELAQIVAWSSIVAVITSAALSLAGAGGPPIGTLIGLTGLLVICDLLLRVAARNRWRRATPPARCLIVGDAELAAQVKRKLRLFADMHLVDAGLVSAARFSQDLARAPRQVLAALAEVDRVVVATPLLSPELIGAIAAVCNEAQVKLSALSPLRGRSIPAPQVTQVADLPMLEFDTSDVSRSTAVLKRAFDAVVGTVGLLLTAPLFPLIALAIKLDSRGPVLFKQLRAGRNGVPFHLYKFRTMRDGADAELDDLVRIDRLEEPVFKLRRDPRLTRVGRILRPVSLDELPQLINVLRGEMSIVGPRPEQVELVERYTPEQRLRLDVKPGITGPMQIHGRGELTFGERLALDLDYIENMSLGRDLRIIALTLPAVVKRDGAY